MLPDSGGICMGVDKKTHRFAPGLPPGWRGAPEVAVSGLRVEETLPRKRLEVVVCHLPEMCCGYRGGLVFTAHRLVPLSLRPHGGAPPFHQKSTFLAQLTLGPHVVHLWSCNTPESGPNETVVLQRVVSHVPTQLLLGTDGPASGRTRVVAARELNVAGKETRLLGGMP